MDLAEGYMTNPFESLASLNVAEVTQRAKAKIEEIVASRTSTETGLTVYSREMLVSFIRSIKPDAIEEEKTLLQNISFTGADLRGLDFSLLHFENVHFADAKLSRKEVETLLPHARQKKVFLRGMNVQGADFSARLLNRKDIGIVKLVRVNFENLDLRETNFKNANLGQADFDGANLQGTNFEGALLKGAWLRNCNLVNTDMIGVDLTEAQLENSDLRGADLRNANITDANFTGVKL